MNKTLKKINQRACNNRIWSWSPMQCEKHGPRPSASVFVYWVPRAMFFFSHGIWDHDQITAKHSPSHRVRIKWDILFCLRALVLVMLIPRYYVMSIIGLLMPEPLVLPCHQKPWDCVGTCKWGTNLPQVLISISSISVLGNGNRCQ